MLIMLLLVAGAGCGCGDAHVYITGKFPNEPTPLVEWIRHPPALDPVTAMPDVGVPEEKSRDMAAYLYLYQLR